MLVGSALVIGSVATSYPGVGSARSVLPHSAASMEYVKPAPATTTHRTMAVIVALAVLGAAGCSTAKKTAAAHASASKRTPTAPTSNLHFDPATGLCAPYVNAGVPGTWQVSAPRSDGGPATRPGQAAEVGLRLKPDTGGPGSISAYVRVIAPD